MHITNWRRMRGTEAAHADITSRRRCGYWLNKRKRSKQQMTNEKERKEYTYTREVDVL